MKRAFAMGAALALALAFPLVRVATANGPNPEHTAGQPYWAPNRSLEYNWLASFVPPAATMQPAISAAATDSNDSQFSNAPLYSFGNDEGLVAYGKTGTNWSCGPQGIACFARSVSGNWFHVNFRVHGQVLTNPNGTQFTVRWCDVDPTPTNCWDVENIALDELGHVLGVGHHVNPDYADAVVQTTARQQDDSPNTGWNAHNYGLCDIGFLQLRYDVTETAGISDCLITQGDGLNTLVTIAANPPSVSQGDPVVFTAHLGVVVSSTYYELSGNNLANRTVSLYRAPTGSSSWVLIGTMSGGGGGNYTRTVTQSGVTYQWQARFVPNSAEGLDGDNSPALTVPVQPCPPC